MDLILKILGMEILSSQLFISGTLIIHKSKMEKMGLIGMIIREVKHGHWRSKNLNIIKLFFRKSQSPE